jgi:hypothetical protein
MAKKNFQVAVMHWPLKDYLKIKEYIIESGFTPRILTEEYSADTIFENISQSYLGRNSLCYCSHGQKMTND